MAAEKISTMILTVDLDCSRCYKKIRKTLCKLQDQENIKSIAYDEKKKTVTISGPFFPQKLFKILCCKACECILEMEIVKKTEEKKPPPPPPPPPPPAVCIPCRCGCGCGWECRPCRCGCGGPCSGELGHYRPCPVMICEEGPTTCIVM